MNRGLWLVCSLSLGTAAAASGCYVGPQPPPPAYVEPPPSPSRWPPTAPSTPRRLRPTPIPEYQPPAPGPGYAWVNGYWDWTGAEWSWTPATGRRRTRPTCSSVRASCSSTGAPSTTAPTGRARAATGPMATDTAAGHQLARGARGRLWRPAPGAPSTTKDGGAPPGRRPGAALRPAVPSPCAAATQDSTAARRLLEEGRPPFTRRLGRPFTPRPAARSAPSHGGGGGRMHH